MAVSRYQYQTPTIPTKWSNEERQYAQRVEELFDQIFSWRDTLLNKFWPTGSIVAMEADKDPNKAIGGKWQRVDSVDVDDTILTLWTRKG